MTVKAGQMWIDQTAKYDDEARVIVISVRRFAEVQRRKYRRLPEDAKEVMFCLEAEYGKKNRSVEVLSDSSFLERFTLA